MRSFRPADENKTQGRILYAPGGLAQGTRPRADMESAPTMNPDIYYFLFILYYL